MDKVEYPESLIYSDGEIIVYYEDRIQVNKTKSAVIIEGNRSGFLSLANLINVYTAYLYSEIVLTDFAFVSSNLKFEIVEDPAIDSPDGRVLMEKNSNIKWKISEINLCVLICSLHSLGYANNELHLDTDSLPSNISVYCVVK